MRVQRRLLVLVLGLGLATAGAVSPVPALSNPSTKAASIEASRGSNRSVRAPTGPIVRGPARADLSPPLSRLDPAGSQRTDARSGRLFSARPLPRPTSGIGAHAADPVLQMAGGTKAERLPGPTVTFEGLDAITANPGFLFILPPDPNIDVGPNHVVQMVNSAFAVYSKAGARLFGPAQINSVWAGFGGKCETNNDGDPIVQYDHLADRWLISQFTATDDSGNIGGPFYECIAISQTPNPTGPYFRYAFFESNTLFHDYPKFGVWPDAYYMSANLFDNANDLAFAGAGAIAFERDRMLAGDPGARMVEFIKGPPFGGQLPSDLDGTTLPPAGSPNFFVEMDDAAFGFPTDRLHVFEFHVDWANPGNSTFTGPAVLDTAPFDWEMCIPSDPTRQCIPQEGTPSRLDAISDRIMYRLAYRNLGDHEAMVLNHTVDIDGTDHAGIRWYELRKAPSPTTDWSIHQQGTYAGDAPLDLQHRWMGSAALDKVGDIAVGYSISGVTRFPSLAYTGRKPGDPLGTLPQGETTLFNGSGSQHFPIGRWGDYSSLVLDPDDCTFWYTNEYYRTSVGTNQAPWRTRIGAFKFPNCGGPSGADLSVAITDTPDPVIVGESLTYHVTVTNNGPDAASAVTLTDVLPSTVTLESASAACTGTTTITCTLGDLAAGANSPVDIVVRPSQTGTLVNTASVSSSTSDPNPANNSASAATLVKPVPPITFGPATVLDPQRTEGEPLNFITPSGDYWESGPWGTSTQQSFVHRSTDGGDQFNVVSPIQLRPDTPPGGGDTDVVVDDQGFAYFSDLELANVGVAVSTDHGNTWRKNPESVVAAGVDRQWLAVDNGPSQAATDNTVFLTVRQLPTTISYVYSTPGSTGPTDPVGGFVYQPATTDTPIIGAPCAQLRFDPVMRRLYIGCASAGTPNHVRVFWADVAAGQRTGLVFAGHQLDAPNTPGGATIGTIPTVTTDSAGNLYAVWADSAFNVYYSYTTPLGGNSYAPWSAPVKVNSGSAVTSVFAWGAAGTTGNLAVAWYATSTPGNPDTFPSWFNDRVAATAVKWFGYAALVQNANTASPNVIQTKFTAKPTYYGQVCLSGTTCAVTGGDRTLLDYMAVAVDPKDGRIRVVFDDATSQHHGAHVFEARQLTGPTATGGTIDEAAPANPVGDGAGDAQTPHYSPVGEGPSLPQYDLMGVELSRPDASTLRVEMTVSDLSSFAAPDGKPNGVWLTRFQALSVGEGGEESYRIFYVGAESVAGAPPTFFAGSGTAASPDGVPGNGCVTNTPENCKLVQYPAEVSATGTIVTGKGPGDTIRIDVPLQGGFGAGRPITTGPGLFNVTAMTFGRTPAPDDIYLDIDATRAFDYPLGSIGGTVHNDLDGDGTFDAGEPGLANVTVFADLDTSGTLDAGEPSAVTNLSGVYVLAGLSAGTYVVDYVVPPGFANTGPKPLIVELSAGQAVTGRDFFAQQRNAAIAGTVYEDPNGNGQADPGESGLSGVLVFLDSNANGTPDVGEAAVTTASDGTYTFTGLAAGSYRVDYVVPPGFLNTGTKPRVVTLTAGQVLTGQDFFARERLIDLSVTKSDSPDPVNAGNTVTYHVTVRNGGPDGTATGVTLTDPLPSSMTFVSATPSQGTCSGTSTVTCALGSLAQGSSATVDIVVRASTAGTFTNTATATGNETDPNTGNNSGSATTTVNPAADLALTMSASPDPVHIGQELVYTVVVSNNGPSSASAVSLNVQLPKNAGFSSASTTQGTCTAKPEKRVVTCNIGTVSNGQQVTVKVTVKPSAKGKITATATVSATTFDPNTANNTAKVTTQVIT